MAATPQDPLDRLPRVLLHLEGLAVFGLSLLLYNSLGKNWVYYPVLFLAPDLSLLGYLVGRRVGALGYNLAHNYILPTAVIVIGLFIGSRRTVAVGLIWFGHIGFDRLLGLGLKYTDSFKRTHIQRSDRGA